MQLQQAQGTKLKLHLASYNKLLNWIELNLAEFNIWHTINILFSVLAFSKTEYLDKDSFLSRL